MSFEIFRDYRKHKIRLNVERMNLYHIHYRQLQMYSFIDVYSVLWVNLAFNLNFLLWVSNSGNNGPRGLDMD